MEIINNIALIFNNLIIKLYENEIEFWQILVALILINFVFYEILYITTHIKIER